MTSTSGPAIEPLECDPGADFVQEFALPGNYAAATGVMQVRRIPGQDLIATGAVTFGAYDAGADTTPMTLTIADTVSAALTPQLATYDVLVTLGALKEFWLAGEFVINARVTQP